MKKHLVVVCSLLMVIMVVGLLACTSATPTPSVSPTAKPATTIPTTTSAPVTTTTPAQTVVTTTPGAAKTLTIGIATPLTGAQAYLGTQISDAVQMAINDQNAKGGVTIGGQNYTLVPMIRDTKGDAATGKGIDQEMISNGVKIIAGPFQADAVAIQPDIEANKVLTFFVNFLTPDMTGPTKPYSFSVSYPNIQEAYKALSYVQKTSPQAKTIFSVEAATPDAPSFSGAMATAAKMLGFNYLGYDQVPLTTTDFTSEITRILGNKPDIVDTGNVGGVMGGLGAQMIKQLGQAGFTGVIMSPAAPPEAIVEQVVPVATLANCVTINVNPNGSVVYPKYTDLLTRFNTTYKMEGLGLVTSYYDDITALFQFLNTQNTMDSAAWMQGFANYKWNGLKGFQAQWVQQNGAGFNDGINRRSLDNPWVSHYVNGKLVTDFTAPIPPGIFLDGGGNPINSLTLISQ